MAVVTYTAKRRLTAGHLVDALYSIEFDATVGNETFTPKVESLKSLSGKIVTSLFNVEHGWSVQTVQLPSALKDQMIEFLTSVAGGEQFLFDPYGTISNPGHTYECIKSAGNIAPTRVGTSSYFTLTFNVIVVGADFDQFGSSQPGFLVA